MDLKQKSKVPQIQCCGSGSVWIRFILVSRIRIRVAKNQPKSWKISTKMNLNHQNIIHFFFKTIKLMFTDINIFPVNNKTDHISEKYIFYRKKVKQQLIFFRFQVGFRARSGSVISRNGCEDPDPYQNETDPQHCIDTTLTKVIQTNQYRLQQCCMYTVHIETLNFFSISCINNKA